MDRYNQYRNASMAFGRNTEYRSTKNLLCANCSQVFIVRDPLRPRGLRCPLLLQCGHSACENCIRTSIQNTKTVPCGSCKFVSSLKNQEVDFRDGFPLNLYLLGIFANRHCAQEPQDSKISFFSTGSSNASRRTSASSLRGKEHKTEPCSECDKDAGWMCQPCQAVYCGSCFTKVHKASKALSKHKKSPLEVVDQSTIPLSLPLCDIHLEQKLEFYCKDCSKLLCSHCVICFHQGHGIITKRQKNTEQIPKLNEAKDAASEVLKRLLRAQKRLGEILMVPTSSCDVGPIEQAVTSHFMYLHGSLQIMEQNIIERLKEAKTESSHNLEKIMNDVTQYIQCVKQLLQDAGAVKDPLTMDKVPVEELTEKLLEVQEMPCHLIFQEHDVTEDPIKFVVEESFLNQIQSHCELKIQDTSLYKLVKAEDLPPDTEIEPIASDDEEAVLLMSASSRASSVSALSEVFSDTASAQNGTSANNKEISRDLLKGSFETVTVSHIKNPASFYVQRISDASTLEQLSSQLTIVANSLTHPTSVIHNGVYIVQYHVDNKWYRARVRNVQKSSSDLVEVLYIDYGNSEMVPVTRLRCIPPKFASQPAFALHCGLFDIVPARGKWTQDDVKILASMVNGNSVKMYIMDYTPDKYLVDLSRVGPESLENNVPESVRDALVFLLHACVTSEQTPRIPTMSNTSNYLEDKNFQTNVVVEVLMSHVDTPNNFYVQRLGDHGKYLSSVMNEMNKEYGKAGNRGLVYKPVIGMPCAAKFSMDKKWYRAKVVDLPRSKMVQVFYVDFGNQEVLEWNELRRLQPQFLRLPAQAIHCSLTDVMPAQQQWTPDVKKFLEGVTQRKVLRMYVDDINHRQLKVTLYHSQENMDLCINGLLVREGYAASVGSSSTIVEYPKLDTIHYSLPPISKKNLPLKSSKKKAVKPVVKQQTSETSGGAAALSEEEEEAEVPVTDPFRLEVKVLSCPSPNCLYVSIVSSEDSFKSLMCDLQAFYTSSTSHVENWEPNSKCCAFSVKHQLWYRGILVEVLPDDQAKVFLKDIAEVEVVPIINLQLLDPKFMQVRDHAIKCHLAGVKAAGDRPEWPSLACEYLMELVVKYPSIYITKKGDIENASLPVELWVKNIIRGGPFDPTVEEWITLNTKLIEQGLAIPIRRETELQNIPSIQVLKELDEQSQEANKNSVSEWLKLSLQAECGSKTEGSELPVDESDKSSLNDSAPETEEAVSIPCEITDWPDPPPLTKKKFKAIPTYVDDNCYVYLHEVEKGEVLNIIGNALLSRFKDSQPKPHDHYWFANQLCVVQYHFDKKWYRGKVLSVNEDDRTIKVQFTDYGNVEDCKASELRKNIYITDIPTVCYKCQLYGIAPLSEDGKWPVNTLDFIHSTIVEKECKITIKEDHREGQPYKISLICPGEVDISEILFKMNYVKYSSCSDFDSVPISDVEIMDEGDSVIVESEDLEDETEDIAKQEEEEEEEKDDNKTDNVEIDKVDVISNKESLSVDSTAHKDTISSISDEHVPWNDLIDIEEGHKDTKVVYKTLKMPNCDTISVEITAIVSANEVLLHPIKEKDSVLYDVKEEFDNMSLEMQEYAHSQPVIKKPYVGQPCCACYTVDDQWYRAEIVEIMFREKKAKIRYVDYGNMEFLPIDKLHKLKPKWAEIPILNIHCKLWNIEVPVVWGTHMFQKMTECVFASPIVAKVKSLQPIFEAELFSADGSTLVYQPLLEEGYLTKKEES